MRCKKGRFWKGNHRLISSKRKSIFHMILLLLVLLATLVSACQTSSPSSQPTTKEVESKITEPKEIETDPTESDKDVPSPVVPIVKEEVNLFVHGLLPVWKGGWGYGYIDETDTYVIEPKFQDAMPFSENGLAAVAVSDKWGYIDKTGAFVIEPQFDRAKSFSENGLAAVEVSGKWGYIDESGVLVIESQFDRARSFSVNGLAAVSLDGDKWGYIDETGAFVIEPQFEDVFSFSVNGPAPVSLNGDKWGYIDETGAFVIEPKFDRAMPFSACGSPAALLAVVKYGLWAYIDRTETVVQGYYPDYLNSEFWSFSANGLAPIVSLDQDEENKKYFGKYGYINEDGAFVIEPQFQYALPFSFYTSNSVAGVRDEATEKWGVIDENGNYIVEPQYFVVLTMCSTDGYLVVKKDDKYGVIDREGHEVIPCQYFDISFQNKLYVFHFRDNDWEDD